VKCGLDRWLDNEVFGNKELNLLLYIYIERERERERGVPLLNDYKLLNDSAPGSLLHLHVIAIWQHFYCGLKCSFLWKRQINKILGVDTHTNEEVHFHITVRIYNRVDE
jgi:hypothetical protein